MDLFLSALLWEQALRNIYRERNQIKIKISWKNGNKSLIITWYGITSGKGITRKSGTALTQGTMISYTAFGIQATCTWAGILTFLINTCFIRRTLCTQNTFRTARRRQTYIVFQTRTNSLII